MVALGPPATYKTRVDVAGFQLRFMQALADVADHLGDGRPWAAGDLGSSRKLKCLSGNLRDVHPRENNAVRQGSVCAAGRLRRNARRRFYDQVIVATCRLRRNVGLALRQRVQTGVRLLFTLCGPVEYKVRRLGLGHLKDCWK
jgi:hypothetical protein